MIATIATGHPKFESEVKTTHTKQNHLSVSTDQDPCKVSRARRVEYPLRLPEEKRRQLLAFFAETYDY